MAPSIELNTCNCEIDISFDLLAPPCDVDETYMKESEQTRRRCVRFASQSDVHHTTHLFDYTIEEFQNCWLTSHDRDRIRRENQRLCRKAVYGKLGSQECIRGLEHYLPQLAEHGDQAIHLSRNAVLREQENSRLLGDQDDDKLRAFYAFAAKRSTERALKQGLQDYRVSLE